MAGSKKAWERRAAKLEFPEPDELWANTGSILALADAVRAHRDNLLELPDWAVDGLLDLIADVLKQDRGRYTGQWKRANSLRKFARLAEVDAMLRIMREHADTEQKLIARIRSSLMRHFPNFDGEPGKDREEDRLIAGELIGKNDGYSADTVKKYVTTFINNIHEVPDPRTMDEIESRMKRIKSARKRTRQPN